MVEKKPFMMVVFSDFNLKSKSWYTNDSTYFESSKIDFLTSSFSFHQIINKPTNSCIDIIFTTQSNLAMESGVHSPLHENCNRQLPYLRLILNVFYPPSHKREV